MMQNSRGPFLIAINGELYVTLGVAVIGHSWPVRSLRIKMVDRPGPGFLADIKNPVRVVQLSAAPPWSTILNN